MNDSATASHTPRLDIPGVQALFDSDMISQCPVIRVPTNDVVIGLMASQEVQSLE